MLSGASQRKISETRVRATRRFLEINSAERQLSLEDGSLRRWRRKRKGSENENDGEKRASERKKDNNVRSLAHLRILSSRFCIFHLGEYVRSAAPHFPQETFYRWRFLTVARGRPLRGQVAETRRRAFISP